METLSNLWNGRIGLAKTYWVYGILGGALWGIPLAFVTPGSAMAIMLVLALIAYCMLVNTGIWRAANQYRGTAVWANLAKVIAAIGYASLFLVSLGLIVVAWEAIRKPTAQAVQQPTAKPLLAAPGSEIDEFLRDVPPSFEAAELWTQEPTKSAEKGPWLNYLPQGSRFCRMANGAIVAVFPPGIKPQAEKANPFCATVSVSSPDQL